jgi:hypothetical protein
MLYIPIPLFIALLLVALQITIKNGKGARMGKQAGDDMDQQLKH